MSAARVARDAPRPEGSARTPQGAGPSGVVSNRYSIYSDKAESFFHVFPGGRVVWENGSATCTACGCEVSSGKRNDEPAEELRARLGGKRARVKGGVLPCAGCGEEYPIRAEEEPFAADPGPLRGAVLQALARPGAPKRSALARAVGLAPENLTHWLAGRRPIPQEKIEAMLDALDLVIVPRPR